MNVQQGLKLVKRCWLPSMTLKVKKEVKILISMFTFNVPFCKIRSKKPHMIKKMVSF
jgi:hypothetical protein